MYFKKLELYGFKSFVDKTTLLFEPGVTAIVGPNGTGKSNISDAIKWVLGEQSVKSMRGSKMEDVIFNGTELRPPVNMAEVSLTLSNEGRHLPIDYDEIRITRRLYRSGESEYLLNKTPVRLRDINELLMGTGIGTESYSLLEQGRIDSIISSKPEDRRIIFEEASGITKFKKKKNEAMRKLQQTEENLLRVNDIVVEVNRQLNSIQRQVNKARRYQEHFQELKNLDTQYTYREYNILKSEQDQFLGEENQCRGSQEQIENELVSISQLFEDVKNTLTQVENDYKDLTNKVMIAETQIEKNTDRVNLNKERIDEFTQRVNDAVIDIGNTNKKIEEVEQQRTLLNERIVSFQEEKHIKENQLNLKKTSLEEIENQIREAKDTIALAKEKAVNLLSEHAQLKNNLAKLSANIHNANARLTRLRQEKSKTEEEFNEINTSLEGKINELNQLKGRVDDEEKKESSLRSSQELLAGGIKNLEEEIQKSKEGLIAKQSQLIVLEDLSKTYEGFSNAVKALMPQKEEFPEQFEGVHDVLVNLIEVSSGYEMCVENALTDYLQAVVVEDSQAMLRLRDFLDSQNIGRVRIIALDTIPVDLTSQVSGDDLQAITNFVNCEDKYKGLMAYLLRNTFLVSKDKIETVSGENFTATPELVEFTYRGFNLNSVEIIGDFNNWQPSSDTTLELTDPGIWTRKVFLSPGHYRYKFIVDGQWITDPENNNIETDIIGNSNSILEITEAVEKKEIKSNIFDQLDVSTQLVTTEGEIYTRTELVTKPTNEHSLGLISQKAQMRQLKEDCIYIDQRIEELANKEALESEQLEKVEAELSQLTEILHHEKVIFANKDSERVSIESAKKKLDDELSVVNLEIEETTLDLNELVEKEKQSKESLEAVEQQIAQNEQEMNCSQDLISDKTREREDLLVVIAEKKTEFSLVNEQEASLNQNMIMLTENYDQMRNNVEELTRQKEESTRRIGELSEQVVNLEQNTTVLGEEKQQIDTQLEQTTMQRSRLLEEFESMQIQIREKENNLNQIKNRIRDMDVRNVELKFKLDALINTSYQSYKIDLASLVMELPEDIDWDQQKEQIDVLKQKVDRLGSVNLAAVEEEEELRERAEFLNSQREDLVAAKETLMQAIRKINRTTKTLFLDTFEQAKVAFREYYKLLFSGGDAQLYLSEDKDVLESGVEIVVRPPGKRLQSITLLSGGEKTLTAIALLFAVFKIKPTPFCVLDEMDAPLDESNIDRFTRVLQEFLKNSQFIIITHNKKTIGMADVMYGVTMGEPGISKLVSVKFSEYKDAPVAEPVEEEPVASAA
ncbi:MAG: AAA family ATPase [PVC group bacterium]|nr:AAA family ATPase [PVC group bacterium]